MALTRVSVSGEEAGHGLQTGHQEVLGQEVQGGLQGRVRPQRALQAAALDEGQVLVFWGRKRPCDRGSQTHLRPN